MATTRLDVSRIWASNDPAVSIIDPGAEKYAIGWIAEIPPLQYINYLQYRMDTNIRALAERGIFEWGADVVYENQALAWDELDGKVYIAQVEGPNSSLSPSNNPSEWELSMLQVSQQVLTDMQAEIDKHEADQANPHGVTAVQAGTYTAEVIDQMLAVVDVAIDVHEADRGNPHGVTAEQAGAVPITGGEYLGLVTFLAGEIEINRGAGARTKKVYGADDGIFLTVDAWGLGLTDAGVPVWRTASEDYPLLFLDEYHILKEQTEPDYAVPVPDFHMPLVSDINIYQGPGTSSYTGPAGVSYTHKTGQTRVSVKDEPMFGVDGLVGVQGQGLSLDTTDILQDFVDFTVSVELSEQSTWMVEVVNQLGIGEVFRYGGSFGGTFPQDARKFTLVKSGTDVRGYVDGVLWASRTSSDLVSLSTLKVGHNSGNVKNLRIWARALTPEQISTL